MRYFAGVALAAIVVACSSSDDATDAATGGGCADIAGNYNVKVTPVSGDCPKGDGKDVQLTIAKDASGYSIVTTAADGACPAELNPTSCKFTATCKVFDTATGNTVARINHDYTFSGTSFTGTVTGTLSPPIADPACTAVARHEGGRLQ